MQKVLLIGTGVWAENHVKAYALCREVELAGVVGHSNEARLNELADGYNIPHRSMNVADAIDGVQPDIVDVAANPQFRLAGLRACIGTSV